MEKKSLKWYEAPQMEIVEMEISDSLLAGSPTSETEEDDEWWKN